MNYFCNLPWKLLPKSLPSFSTGWNVHNKKIVKTAALIVIPMLAFTITMLCLVFVNQIDPTSCPFPELCSKNFDQNTISASTIYTGVPVGRLAFVSSISATFAGLLVAAQMTLFSYSIASRLLDSQPASNTEGPRTSPYAASLLIRLLSAEIPLLWDLGTRRVALLVSNKVPRKNDPAISLSLAVLLVSLACSLLTQGANTYFHVAIEATNVALRSTRLSQDFNYSFALGPWCQDPGETLGTMDNLYFWGCAVSLKIMPKRPGFGEGELSLLRKAHHNEIDQDYQKYMINYTDAHDVTYAIIKPSYVNASADWIATSYAASTSCRAIAPASCNFDPEAVEGRYWSFNCSSVHAGLEGDISNAAHGTRLEDFHEHLHEPAPFIDNYQLNGINVSRPAFQHIVKNATASDTNRFFKNPFTFVSHIDVAGGNEGRWPEAIENSDLPWKWRMRWWKQTKFIYSCSTDVWDVKYTMIDGKVENFIPTRSNGTVTGIVSMASGQLASGSIHKQNSASLEVNRPREDLTPNSFTKAYELETSKVMISNLVVYSVPKPVDFVQLRANTVITRLPAIALWLLVTSNILFVLLAITLAILAAQSASSEVHQVHLRLSSSGLAAQLLSLETARCEAKDDFGLFHKNEDDIVEDDTEEQDPTVEIRSNALGGAEFVVHPLELKSIDSHSAQEFCVGDEEPLDVPETASDGIELAHLVTLEAESEFGQNPTFGDDETDQYGCAEQVAHVPAQNSLPPQRSLTRKTV